MHLQGRREVLGTLLSPWIGGALLASKCDEYGAALSVPRDERHDFGAVRAHILQAISQGKATSVAVAVARHGKVVWEEGFGWANRETGLKVTPRTPFSLASITKPFTTHC